MRAALALAAAAMLGACAFWSSEALFDDDDAATPIADGARFVWIEDDVSETQIVTYRRAGTGYEVASVGSDETPLRVIFVEVRETPEEDYIAQVATRTDEQSRFYAFMWRTGEGYRLVAAPSVVAGSAEGGAALAKRCAARPNGECRFGRAADVMAFYREAIYPAFVLAGETPSDYIDQIAVVEPPEGK